MPETLSAPSFVATLAALSEDHRKAALAATHREFADHRETWQIHLDAFEGEGGFLDGGYLWPYPSESEDDFGKRCKMARYHNYVETLVDLYVRFMFTQGVRRQSKSAEYNAWLTNVDGAGTGINDLLKRFAAVALVPGHAGLLIDKTPEAPVGPTRADERARVFATIYPATSIADWRFARNTLTGVKLLEAAPEPPLLSAPDADDQHQYLIWNTEGWARFNTKGALLGTDAPNLGLVPFVILRPKPRLMSPILGRALISNVNVVRALFNRCSEEDEVLRSQAFSVLTVSVPPDGDVASARTQLGSAIGASKALVVQGQVDYKTPDQNVPAAIRANTEYLVHELYRAAHMRFNRDSLSAESAEAIRLQHSELNEMLQGFSKALAESEKQIARAWFAWMHPTPEAAQQAFEAAQVEATYPDEFFLDALINQLEEWTQSIRMNLGDTMGRRIKKKAVRRIDPDIPADELKKIDAEIDALPVEPPSPFPLDSGRPDDVVPPGEAETE